jgi:hypothetical protein
LKVGTNIYQIVCEIRDTAGLLAKGWTQGTYARNSAGDWVDPSSPEATCWCVSGAFVETLGNSFSPAENVANRAIGLWLINVNDSPDTAPGDMEMFLLFLAEALESEAREREVRASKIREAAGYLAQGWCTGSWARNAYGQSASPTGDKAVSWCAAGAMQRANTGNAYTEYGAYLNRDEGSGSFLVLNDNHAGPGDMEMFFLFIAEDIESTIHDPNTYFMLPEAP